VVLIEAEHGEVSAARKLVQSHSLLGIGESGLDRLVLVARKAVRLGSPVWQDVQRLIRAGLVSDIFLDTLSRVAPANADNEAEQVAIFDGLGTDIERGPEGAKPTVWVVSHTRKNGAGGLADVSGSVQRTGQADSVLMLRAERVGGLVRSVTVSFEKLREAPDDEPPPAVFTIAKDDHGTRVLQQGDAQEDDPEQPLPDRVLAALALGPKTKNALATKLKRSKADIDDSLSNLFSAHRIRTTEIHVRGRPRKAFELRPVRVTTEMKPSRLPGFSRDDSRDDRS
jgi:hypothetical protein